MTAKVIYKGVLRCECTHEQSGTIIETDAPTDNKGKGERFSPTDTVCVALATCMITTMAIKTAGMGLDLAGTKMEVTKHMITDPRRIGAIDINLNFPATLQLNDDQKVLLQKIAETCPVAESLSKDVMVNVVYNW
ncbi:MAG: OsmC family protein [Chitinophagaceae bacterium]|nr:OsmC family protein [Chitinophagaceae bacterium]